MSTRFHISSLSDIEPMRNCVASKDTALVDALSRLYFEMLREEYGDDDPDNDDIEDFNELIASMIQCDEPPDKEPGSWNSLFELLVKHLQLEVYDDLPVNDGWKHYHVWEQYRALFEHHLDDGASASLLQLQKGRPLRGREIEHDGCVFSWLTPAEVQNLNSNLEKIVDNSLIDEEMREFHEGFSASIAEIAKRNDYLLLEAS